MSLQRSEKLFCRDREAGCGMKPGANARGAMQLPAIAVRELPE